MVGGSVPTQPLFAEPALGSLDKLIFGYGFIECRINDLLVPTCLFAFAFIYFANFNKGKGSIKLICIPFIVISSF